MAPAQEVSRIDGRQQVEPTTHNAALSMLGDKRKVLMIRGFFELDNGAKK